jgi:hypothetical protein
MKLIEKLAEDSKRENTNPLCCACDDDYLVAYGAGFRKAREMAVAQVRAEPYMQPQANCLEFRIEQLGDSEVEDETRT